MCESVSQKWMENLHILHPTLLLQLLQDPNIHNTIMVNMQANLQIHMATQNPPLLLPRPSIRISIMAMLLLLNWSSDIPFHLVIHTTLNFLRLFLSFFVVIAKSSLAYRSKISFVFFLYSLNLLSTIIPQ